jgi:acetyltransferase-like isoleucine patch superfamily enzyme
VRTRRIVAGDNAFFAEDVEVGGGGAMDPEAELRIGSHGFIGEHVHLNTCRPLVIGDEVVISRNAVVMTHSFGGSVLAGYPNRFAGVTLGDGCQVGIHGVLFPGVEMGAGSILLSGSSLVSSVPPGRLYGGVPAQDLKAAARPVTPVELVALAREQIVEFARQLSLRGREVEVEENGDAVSVVVTAGGARHLLRFAQDLDGDPSETPAEDVRVCCRCADDAWDALPVDIVVLDLSVPRVRGAQGPLADALREFLRKRGVRLHPRSWTYRGGWL